MSFWMESAPFPSGVVEAFDWTTHVPTHLIECHLQDQQPKKRNDANVRNKFTFTHTNSDDEYTRENERQRERKDMTRFIVVTGDPRETLLFHSNLGLVI